MNGDSTGGPGTPPRDRVGELTADFFRPLVGHSFSIEAAPGVAPEAVLSEVREAAGGMPGGRRPFSILLRGPLSPRLPQRIYGVSHAGEGTIGGIFLVPLGPDRDAMRYEAVFG